MEDTEKGGISRRNFLKKTALVAGGAIGGAVVGEGIQRAIESTPNKYPTMPSVEQLPLVTTDQRLVELLASTQLDRDPRLVYDKSNPYALNTPDGNPVLNVQSVLPELGAISDVEIFHWRISPDGKTIVTEYAYTPKTGSQTQLKEIKGATPFDNRKIRECLIVNRPLTAKDKATVAVVTDGSDTVFGRNGILNTEEIHESSSKVITYFQKHRAEMAAQLGLTDTDIVYPTSLTPTSTSRIDKPTSISLGEFGNFIYSADLGYIIVKGTNVTEQTSNVVVIQSAWGYRDKIIEEKDKPILISPTTFPEYQSKAIDTTASVGSFSPEKGISDKSPFIIIQYARGPQLVGLALVSLDYKREPQFRFMQLPPGKTKQVLGGNSNTIGRRSLEGLVVEQTDAGKKTISYDLLSELSKKSVGSLWNLSSDFARLQQ